jgi:hypothetical protein
MCVLPSDPVSCSLVPACSNLSLPGQLSGGRFDLWLRALAFAGLPPASLKTVYGKKPRR